MTQTFNEKVVVNESVEINGSDGDAVQLRVEGAQYQAQPLQIWQTNGDDVLAQITADGRLQIGDQGISTPDALIEASKEVAASDLQRGLNTHGQINVDAPLNQSASWSVHELELTGQELEAVSGMHTALRAKLTYDNNGGSTEAELRAGDFEAINQQGDSQAPVGQMTGLRGTASNGPGAYLDKAVGVEASISNETSGDMIEAAAFEVAVPVNTGTIDTLYGLRIPDLTQGTANVAIQTGQGVVRVGDHEELRVLTSAPTADPPANFVKVYPKLSDGVPKLYAKDAAGIEHSLIGGGGGGTGEPLSVTKADFETRTVLYNNTLTADGTWDVQNIDQGYDRLELVIVCRSTIENNVDYVYVYMNNDTTDANYDYRSLFGDGITVDTLAGTSPIAGHSAGSTSPTGQFSSLYASIPNYAGGQHKLLTSRNSTPTAGGELYTAIHDVSWGTGAINRLAVKTSAGCSFSAGSSFQIVGVKKTSLVTDVANIGGATKTIVARTKLATVTLMEVGLLDISDIPDTYDKLEIEYLAKSTYAGAEDMIQCYFNGDFTDAHYYTAQHYGGTSHGASGLAYPRIGYCSAATSPAGNWGAGIIEIPFYTLTRYKVAFARTLSPDAATTQYSNTNTFVYQDTIPVNRISLKCVNATNGYFAMGSQVIVYGVREETLGSGSGKEISVREADNSPLVEGISSIIFPNGTLADLGDGVVQYTPPGGSIGNAINVTTDDGQIVGAVNTLQVQPGAIEDLGGGVGRLVLGAVSAQTIDAVTDELIQEIALAADAVNIDFLNIPQDYDDLHIKAFVKTTGSQAQVYIHFNGDFTLADYSSALHHGGTGTGNARYAYPFVGYATVYSHNAAAFDPLLIEVPWYRRAGIYRYAQSQYAIDESATAHYVGKANAVWRSTSAVTRITLVVANGQSMMAGSRAVLYGKRRKTLVTSVQGGAPLRVEKKALEDVGATDDVVTNVSGSVVAAMPDYILIRDEKTQGTAGGTFTSGAWQTRNLNTEVSDSGSWATLASNQITLKAGTYRVRIDCPGEGCGVHQARLYNISDSAVLLTGSSAYADSSTPAESVSRITGQITLVSDKVLEIQHQCGATRATDGLGAAANFGTEVYTVAEFWREPETGRLISLVVEETDGTPSITGVNKLKVTPGVLTDEGNGVVSLDFAAAVTRNLTVEGGNGLPSIANVTKIVSKGTSITDNGSGQITLSNDGYSDYIAFGETQAQNTAGGNFDSGAWRTRVLNTVISDEGGYISLASNQFTLLPGSYVVDIEAPASGVGLHQAMLYNVTDSVAVLYGTTEYAPSGCTTRSRIRGKIASSYPKVYEIRHQCQNSVATTGFGTAANFGTEMYTMGQIWRRMRAAEWESPIVCTFDPGGYPFTLLTLPKTSMTQDAIGPGYSGYCVRSTNTTSGSDCSIPGTCDVALNVSPSWSITKIGYYRRYDGSSAAASYVYRWDTGTNAWVQVSTISQSSTAWTWTEYTFPTPFSTTRLRFYFSRCWGSTLWTRLDNLTVWYTEG
jgi:hypothetical protein